MRGLVSTELSYRTMALSSHFKTNLQSPSMRVSMAVFYRLIQGWYQLRNPNVILAPTAELRGSRFTRAEPMLENVHTYNVNVSIFDDFRCPTGAHAAVRRHGRPPLYRYMPLYLYSLFLFHICDPCSVQPGALKGECAAGSTTPAATPGRAHDTRMLAHMSTPTGSPEHPSRPPQSPEP